MRAVRTQPRAYACSTLPVPSQAHIPPYPETAGLSYSTFTRFQLPQGHKLGGKTRPQEPESPFHNPVEEVYFPQKHKFEPEQAFADEFLIRLADPGLNPGGKYNSLLFETTALYQNYYGTIVNQLLKEAVGKGSTIAMNEALEAVITKLSTLQGLIKYKFGEDSSVYKEFYPQGMKQYHHARLGKQDIIMLRFRSMATMHLSADYPDEVAEVTTLINKFIAARQTQEGVYGQVSGFASDRKNHRTALTRQLTKCFLILAADCVENPVRFHAYYDTRELPIRKAKKKKKEEAEQ